MWDVTRDRCCKSKDKRESESTLISATTASLEQFVSEMLRNPGHARLGYVLLVARAVSQVWTLNSLRDWVRWIGGEQGEHFFR